MKRYEMIKDRNIFNKLINKGKFNKNKYFVIYYEKNDTDKTNYGIAISKKYGKAVEKEKFEILLIIIEICSKKDTIIL